jgi:hypothetical protein
MKNGRTYVGLQSSRGSSQAQERGVVQSTCVVLFSKQRWKGFDVVPYLCLPVLILNITLAN